MRPGRLWWLPAGGFGNGLDDAAWAPVLEISEQIVPDVLRALANAGVPGYAAHGGDWSPPRLPGRALARGRGRGWLSAEGWLRLTASH